MGHSWGNKYGKKAYMEAGEVVYEGQRYWEREIGFKADPSAIERLEINYRRDERVLRFLTVKMDKNAAAYAAKRQALKKKED